MSEKDIASYQNKINTHQRQKEESLKDKNRSTPKRKNVQKDMWLTQDNGQRFHYRLCSDLSVLNLVSLNNKWEIVEELKGITGWMQEKLYFVDEKPWQQIRYLSAEKGFYSYSSHYFEADSVFLSFYRLPFHNLPVSIPSKYSPSLEGKASQVSLTIEGSNPRLKAKHFEALVASLKNEKS